jgi:uncharacterized protein
MAKQDPASVEQHEHHAIDYIELTVTDMAAATRFYTAAFGWRFNEYGPGYSGIQGKGREVGGLRLDSTVTTGTSPNVEGVPNAEMPVGANSGHDVLVLLFSRDLDATVEAVRRAGGRIVKEPYSFPGGRRFHFSDPSGNELGVWAEA